MDNKFRNFVLILFVLFVVFGCLFLSARELQITDKYNIENDNEMYDDFAKAVARMDKTHTFDDKEDAERAYEELSRLHPEIFWLDNSFTYVGKGDGIEITMKYRTNKMIANLGQLLLDYKINSIVKKVEGMDDVAKVKYVHDYILRTSSYNSSGKYAYTAFGCLIFKDTVCQGYADAYRMILNEAGVECGYVWGKVDGRPHAWNYVSVDGNYYMVDVTFDDPVYNKDLTSIEDHYSYFLVSTDKIRETHSISGDCNPPYCISDHELYH